MAIPKKENLHGAIILRITEELSKANFQFSYFKGSDSAYTFNLLQIKNFLFSFFNLGKINRKKIGVFIKVSSSRRSPWRYTFSRENQEEIERMKSSCDITYILLRAEDEGVAALSYDQLKKLLDDQFDDTEWVSVEKNYNQYFRIGGKNAKLKEKIRIPQNSFPKNIIDDFKSL